ncbi:MAG: hypothetical protein NC390_04095 [Fusobacterium sp.]|nr:hypothetical protein [Fusobacterium sp.]
MLILFLLIGAFRQQPDIMNSFLRFADSDNKIEEKVQEEPVVVNEFEHLKDVKKTETPIDINTARSYIKEVPISGTQMLALTKVKKISPYLNTNKKVIVYVTSEHGSDVEAFLKEFSKTRTHFANSPDVVFLPRESVWNLTEENIKNSHDRAVFNLQKDCGLFCVIIPNQEKLVRMKGSNVNKKTAQIMHVYLTH